MRSFRPFSLPRTWYCQSALRYCIRGPKDQQRVLDMARLTFQDVILPVLEKQCPRKGVALKDLETELEWNTWYEASCGSLSEFLEKVKVPDYVLRDGRVVYEKASGTPKVDMASPTHTKIISNAKGDLQTVIARYNSLHETNIMVEYVSQRENNKWVSSCTVDGKTFMSLPYDKKVDAEQNAASVARAGLRQRFEAKSQTLEVSQLKDVIDVTSSPAINSSNAEVQTALFLLDDLKKTQMKHIEAMGLEPMEQRETPHLHHSKHPHPKQGVGEAQNAAEVGASPTPTKIISNAKGDLQTVIARYNSLHKTNLMVEYKSKLEDNKWVSSCMVDGKTFISLPFDKKVDAEQNAASAAHESFRKRFEALIQTPEVPERDVTLHVKTQLEQMLGKYPKMLRRLTTTKTRDNTGAVLASASVAGISFQSSPMPSSRKAINAAASLLLKDLKEDPNKYEKAIVENMRSAFSKAMESAHVDFTFETKEESSGCYISQLRARYQSEHEQKTTRDAENNAVFVAIRVLQDLDSYLNYSEPRVQDKLQKHEDPLP